MRALDRFKKSHQFIGGKMTDAQRQNPEAYKTMFGEADALDLLLGIHDGFDRLRDAEVIILAVKLMLENDRLIDTHRLRIMTIEWLERMDE
jgi:hypothetical protein